MFFKGYYKPQKIALDHAIPLGDFGLDQGIGLALQTAATGWGAYTQYEQIQNQNQVSAAQQRLLDAQAQLVRANAASVAASAGYATTPSGVLVQQQSVAPNSNIVYVGAAIGVGALAWLLLRKKR